MANSKIEWTQKVWNPVTGCSKVSQGCKNCYAETFANRFWKERKFTDVQCNDEKLTEPLCWKKPRRIFVNSMSDLFHEQVPFEFISKFWQVMGRTNHTYMILTKRPARILEFWEWTKQELKNAGLDEWWKGYCVLPNVWLGVSVEDQQTADERIPLLLQTPAAIRFVSCEPLLDHVDLWSSHFQALAEYGNGDTSVDWVIAGGESGRKARPCHPDWIRSLRDQCKESGVPFFFKQWGEFIHVEQMLAPNKLIGYSGTEFKKIGKKKAGRLLDGIEHNDLPINL